MYYQVWVSPSVQTITDASTALALTMPYGVLADKIGRRPFVILSTVATALSECWPRVLCTDALVRLQHYCTDYYRLVQLASPPDLVDRGVPSTRRWWPVCYIHANDYRSGRIQWGTKVLELSSFKKKNRILTGSRATALFCLVSLPIIAEVIATPISATTMIINPWIPFMLGPIIVLFGAASSTLVPETLDESNRRPVLEDSDDREVTGSFQESLSKENLIRLVVSKAKLFVIETEFIWKNPKLLISLTVVFAGILDKSSLFLLIQYASAKYHWTISQVGSRLWYVSSFINHQYRQAI